MISNSSMTGLPFNIRSTGWQGLEVIQQIRGEAHRMSNFLRGEKAVTMEGTSTEHVCGTMSGRRSPCLQEWVHDCMVLNLFSQSFSFPTMCSLIQLPTDCNSIILCIMFLEDKGWTSPGKGKRMKREAKEGHMCVSQSGWFMHIHDGMKYVN